MNSTTDLKTWRPFGRIRRLLTDCPITIGLAIAMLVFNLGLVDIAPTALRHLPKWLEYDAARIPAGEIWRLVTGNLVHWSAEHAVLDVGAFVAVGLMYERRLRSSYSSVLLAGGLCVSLALFAFQPELTRYRGFSGINSAQFAAVVVMEMFAAAREPKRWLWVAPAAAIFAIKILSECATGQMFFGTEALGDIGLPVPLAHAAGATSGALIVLLSNARMSLLVEPTVAPNSIQVCQNSDSRGAW